MTPEEQAALSVRIAKAQNIRQKLEQAEILLKALQGNAESVDQHEVVAGQLQQTLAYAPVTGVAFWTSKHGYETRWYEQTMPREVTMGLVQAVRALVKHLREEYAAV